MSGKSKGKRKLARNRVIKQIEDHAPKKISQGLKRSIASDVIDNEMQNMIVLAADIRRSTFVMKEAVDFGHFADTLNEFVTATSKFVRKNAGWWDEIYGRRIPGILDVRRLGSGSSP